MCQWGNVHHLNTTIPACLLIYLILPYKPNPQSFLPSALKYERLHILLISIRNSKKHFVIRISV